MSTPKKENFMAILEIIRKINRDRVEKLRLQAQKVG